MAAVTLDVYHYLRNPGVRDTIDEGVRAAISSDAETVVVGHSLGTVVTYNLLRREGEDSGWKVPLYVTLGSPLAVTAIRKALQPIRSLATENKIDVVDNHTDNQHGIAGYLDDPVVARRIHDALTAP